MTESTTTKTTTRRGTKAATPPATDATTSKDASVLNGVTRTPDETKPARRGRTTKTTETAKPETAKAPTTRRGRTSPASAPAKPATRGRTSTKPETAPPADANGSGPSAREANQALAVRLIDLVAKNFGSESPENQVKIANWLKVLPTGGAGWQRYWPQGFARPTTADWQKPE